MVDLVNVGKSIADINAVTKEAYPESSLSRSEVRNILLLLRLEEMTIIRGEEMPKKQQ